MALGHRKCWARLKCQGEWRIFSCPAGASGCLLVICQYVGCGRVSVNCRLVSGDVGRGVVDVIGSEIQSQWLCIPVAATKTI